MNELTQNALKQVPTELRKEAERLFNHNDLFWLLYADNPDEADFIGNQRNQTHQSVKPDGLIKLFYAGRAIKPLFHSGVEAIEYAISGVSGKIHVDYVDSHHHISR